MYLYLSVSVFYWIYILFGFVCFICWYLDKYAIYGMFHDIMQLDLWND